LTLDSSLTIDYSVSVFGNRGNKLTFTKKPLEWSASSNNGADVTLKEFRIYLQEQIDAVGGVRELARQKGLSPSSISKVLHGEIPSDDFLSKFGFKRRITIVRK
jgi:transcriptional regulator with XRE-family HTH domain